MPSNQEKIFNIDYKNNWIIGGEIYNLPENNIKIRRHTEGSLLKKEEQQLYITLNAIDTGKNNGRISLNYKKEYIYPAKESSRAYATLRIIGKKLNEEQQINICRIFNEFLEKKRNETNSLFLPQFRETKEYARKRIPFELAYKILAHLINQYY